MESSMSGMAIIGIPVGVPGITPGSAAIKPFWLLANTRSLLASSTFMKGSSLSQES